jgi:hypothetical protein
MRLSNAQVQDVVRQTKARVVPPNHPIVPQLEQVFGLHTFFLKPEGLHVVERGGLPSPEGDPAFIVKVADWADERHTLLAPQRYEVAGAIDIGPELADLPRIDPDTDERDPMAGHGRRRRNRGSTH